MGSWGRGTRGAAPAGTFQGPRSAVQPPLPALRGLGPGQNLRPTAPWRGGGAPRQSMALGGWGTRPPPRPRPLAAEAGRPLPHPGTTLSGRWTRRPCCGGPSPRRPGAKALTVALAGPWRPGRPSRPRAWPGPWVGGQGGRRPPAVGPARQALAAFMGFAGHRVCVSGWCPLTWARLLGQEAPTGSTLPPTPGLMPSVP